MSNNPLKQYFRRPSIYIKLPSGGSNYPPGVLDMPASGELPVYPMTAIDEITSRTPDALFNGQAVVDIIHSCVPAFKDAWMVSSVDLDTIIMAIRVASNGEDMDIQSTCPACKNEAKFGINLTVLMAQQENVDYTTTLKIRDLQIKFRPLNYRERNQNNLNQYEVQKTLYMLEEIEDIEEKKNQTNAALKRLNDLLVRAFVATIESITTPETTVTEQEYIREFLENCDRQTSNAIKEYSTNLAEKNRIKPFKIKCISCGHDYEQAVVMNITDFFV